jgi:hypothetical protein
MQPLLNSEELLQLPKLKPQEICGVYFLFLKDQLIYIGSSYNIFQRINIHKKSKIFDCFSFIQTSKDERQFLEQEYINRFKPDLNKKFFFKSDPNFITEIKIRKKLKKLDRYDLTRNLKKILNQIKSTNNFNHYSIKEVNNKLNIDLYAI